MTVINYRPNELNCSINMMRSCDWLKTCIGLMTGVEFYKPPATVCLPDIPRLVSVTCADIARQESSSLIFFGDAQESVAHVRCSIERMESIRQWRDTY